MKIHEFQAKELLRRFGVAVPRGRECTTSQAAADAFLAMRKPVCVVKAQIHAGGRGKAGGVKLVRSAEEARAVAHALLGRSLVTHQTGPGGQVVRRLWIEEGSEIAAEYYVGIALDREKRLPVMMASSEGGMEIEEVAAHSPEKILREAFSPKDGLSEPQARRLAQGIGLPSASIARACAFMRALAKAYVDLDCSIAEINPLVRTKSGEVLALDAKINFDSNALFRHEELLALRDLHEEDPKEIEASRFDLSYIALDGDIGCMVNGAGLAMATMDVIKLHGSAPANFLDVGGGATKEKVSAAFKILLSDPNVKGVLVNIFGGIMRCDVIAEGVIAAVKEVALSVPLVVRLEGTNVDKGRELLERSGLSLITAKDLDDAAEKICSAVRRASASARSKPESRAAAKAAAPIAAERKTVAQRGPAPGRAAGQALGGASKAKPSARLPALAKPAPVKNPSAKFAAPRVSKAKVGASPKAKIAGAARKRARLPAKPAAKGSSKRVAKAPAGRPGKSTGKSPRKQGSQPPARRASSARPASKGPTKKALSKEK